MREDLPVGTVTFLFTDIEGSTRLLRELGADGYAAALAGHRSILRAAFAEHGGVEVDTQGDAFFVVFPTADGALAAAARRRTALRSGPIRVRIGVHTGEVMLTDEGYVGEELHRAARIAAAGHGGQVVVSKQTRDRAGADITDLGEHRVKDFAEPVWLFQLGSERFPPLKTISNTNLPRPARSFVGRERERQEIDALLQNGARLVTLSGPGGSGKTRLAIEAAGDLVPSFANGVFWVGLATLRDPALVLGAIAETLGAKEELADLRGRARAAAAPGQLRAGGRRGAGARGLCSRGAGICALLVTSRELLRVRGEVTYPVPPLAEPEGVELFCLRSRLEASPR